MISMLQGVPHPTAGRAESIGLTATYAPVILIVMNVAYADGAYPFGHLSDRLS